MIQSKATYAYETIKEKILSGRLPAPSTISEDALQEELKISRTPIREALRTLEHEGFVEIYPRKGISVAPVSLDLLRDVYDVRLAIEPLITRRACGKIPDATLRQFRERFLNPPTLAEDRRSLGHYYNGVDADFHRALYHYAQNRFLSDSLSLVADHERRIRNMAFNPATNHVVTAEHVAIIDALLERDEEKSFSMAQIHVECARKNAFRNLLDL